MKKVTLGLLTVLALFAGGYMIASSSQCAQHCTGRPDCPCNPCPFK